MLVSDLVLAIGMMTLVTFSQKAIPFAALSSFKNSRSIAYLAERLPPAVMLVLVMYALRIQWEGFSKASLVPILASIFTAIVHVFLRQVLTSIAVGVLMFSILNKFIN